MYVFMLRIISLSLSLMSPLSFSLSLILPVLLMHVFIIPLLFTLSFPFFLMQVCILDHVSFLMHVLSFLSLFSLSLTHGDWLSYWLAYSREISLAGQFLRCVDVVSSLPSSTKVNCRLAVSVWSTILISLYNLLSVSFPLQSRKDSQENGNLTLFPHNFSAEMSYPTSEIL